MTVKQTLSLDDCIRLLAEMAEEAEGKRDAADNRASATTGAVKVMEENERDRYAQEHEALTRAIAIIKTAQEWRQIKLEHIKDPIGTTWEMQHAEDVLLSLLSPKQEQKKEA